MEDPLSYCLVLLKRRLRTAKELDEAMARKGVEPERRKSVLMELTELGIVDDYAFAQAWSRTRDKLSPRGSLVLRQELLQKGVNKEVIDRVLAERKQEAGAEDTDQPTELELAQDLVRRRERAYAGLPGDVRKRRLMSLLQRRGFSYDVVRRILDA